MRIAAELMDKNEPDEKGESAFADGLGNEDMPNAISEAMLLGKPIVGTRTAGIPEQIDDGVNGYLVSPGDPIDLANKINKLIIARKLQSLQY